MEIVDWMVDFDNHLRAEFGEEGVAWDYAEEGEVAIWTRRLDPLFERHRLRGAEAEANSNVSWGPLAQYYGSAEFRDSQVQPLDIYEELVRATSGGCSRPRSPTPRTAAQAFPYWNLWIPAEDASELVDRCRPTSRTSCCRRPRSSSPASVTSTTTTPGRQFLDELRQRQPTGTSRSSRRVRDSAG